MVAEVLVFRRVKHPPFTDRYIPDDSTYAWDDLGARHPAGVCQHTMVGTLWGTDTYFRQGAAGLTDYGVGGAADGKYNGVILRWNDPNGRRSGWANGGSDGLEGPGIPFVRALGTIPINRDLVSIERSDGGDVNSPMTAEQFEAIAQLTAYWFDQAEVPYHAYPINPRLNLVTHFGHRDFAVKGCPWDAVLAEWAHLQDRVRDIMKAAQVEKAGVPEPVPTPSTGWPNAWTTDALATQFGALIEVRIDKRNTITGTSKRRFDPRGMISNLWVSRAVAEGITDVSRIPKPSHVTITMSKDGVSSSLLNIPRSGYKDWIGVKADGLATWKWVY